MARLSHLINESTHMYFGNQLDWITSCVYVTRHSRFHNHQVIYTNIPSKKNPVLIPATVQYCHEKSTVDLEIFV